MVSSLVSDVSVKRKRANKIIISPSLNDLNISENFDLNDLKIINKISGSLANNLNLTEKLDKKLEEKTQIKATKKTRKSKKENKQTEEKVTITKNEVVEETVINTKEEIISQPKIKKKILFVTSEAQPFCATGGLADVCGSLPKEIKRLSPEIDIRVVLPLYKSISDRFKNDFKFIGYNYTTLSWRREYCGVFEYEISGVKFYFLDNERYFKRDNLYGYYDDGERFAFFSKSVLEILPVIGYFPDVIHSNDWQSALIPVYLKTTYFDDRYSSIRTVLTIHNIEYQGRFGQEILVDVLGIDKKFKNLLTYDKDINILKAGIVCCDKLTTVSPSYAQEIKSEPYGSGLHHIISENSYKLKGILNGLDYDFYNPLCDSIIYHKFGLENLSEKYKNKECLQREFNLEVSSEKPIIGFCSRMNKHKGFDIIKNSIEKIICETDAQLVGVGCGDKQYEDFFKYLNYKYKGRVHISLGFSNDIGRKIYSGADIYIMPSIIEPCGLSQIIASKYGVVPVIHETGGLKDTIKDFGCEGGGNGYTFSSALPSDFEYSVKRAINDYYDKPKWIEKVTMVMSKDFSWNKTANSYTETYMEL